VRGQIGERIAHVGQFGDAFVELGHMFERDRLHLGTGPRPVLPERQQLADILDEKAEPPRLSDETQCMDFVRTVEPVTGVAPLAGSEKA
jgi:hypothetical protein